MLLMPYSPTCTPAIHACVRRHSPLCHPSAQHQLQPQLGAGHWAYLKQHTSPPHPFLPGRVRLITTPPPSSPFLPPCSQPARCQRAPAGLRSSNHPPTQPLRSPKPRLSLPPHLTNQPQQPYRRRQRQVQAAQSPSPNAAISGEGRVAEGLRGFRERVRVGGCRQAGGKCAGKMQAMLHRGRGVESSRVLQPPQHPPQLVRCHRGRGEESSRVWQPCQQPPLMLQISDVAAHASRGGRESSQGQLQGFCNQGQPWNRQDQMGKEGTVLGWQQGLTMQQARLTGVQAVGQRS